jgi:hypothetical protein
MSDDQRIRSIVLALWPKLKRDQWGRVHERDLDDYGDRPPYRSICTATIPNVARSYSQHRISDPLAIVATIHTGEIALLTAEAYERAYIAMTSDEQRALYASFMGNRPPPYRFTTIRGERYVRNTETGWDAAWAPAARRALAKIALATAVATTAEVTRRVLDARSATLAGS